MKLKKIKNYKDYILALIISVVMLFVIKTLVVFFYRSNSKTSKEITNLVYYFKKSYGDVIFYLLLLILTWFVVYLIIKKYKEVRRDKSFNKYINKYIIKFLFTSIIYMILSFIIAEIVTNGVYVICISLQNSSSDILSTIGKIYFAIYHAYLDPVLNYFICIIVYIVLSKKRIERFKNLMILSGKISEGNMDILINDNKDDEISYISKNIDNIVTKLKTITDKERKAQKTKNDLITNVSHDLRTPLTSIIGYLSLIENDEYKDEVELRYYISIAYEKSKRLNVLINDLFELTKMQNYQVKLNNKRINLIELLGQLTAEFEVLLKQNNIEQRIDFCKDKLIINADADKIVRVFENLITNSIKYAKDGHFIDIVARKDGDVALVRIVNYGEEIPESELPFIFDRFYKVDKSRNSSVKGSGLGLSIAKNIVELHKGTIRAYSTAEETVFEVKLPLYKE